MAAAGAAAMLGQREAAADPTRALQTIELNCATYKILEIYMSGGLNHRETTWVEDSAASPVWRQIASITPSMWSSHVSSSLSLPYAGWTFPIRSSTTSMRGVHLGPCALPMNGHALGNRVRVVATRHDLFPHEGGGALTLTGLPFGRSRGAGLGTVIQRRWGTSSTPVAFNIVRDNFYGAMMSEVGVHSAAHQPIFMHMPNDLVYLLDRYGTGYSYQSATDAALQYYEARYKGRLNYPGGGPARSVGHDAYATANRRLIDAPALRARLASGPSMGGMIENAMAGQTYGRRSIEMAAHLLNTGARYVGVIDIGTEGYYDTHFAPISSSPSTADHALYANRNVFHILHELREQVDAGTLNLSNTLIVLNTEFGRTRDDVAGSTGTNHWPLGYATVLIGGPLVGRSVAGDIDFSGTPGNYGGIATGGPSGDGYTPTDLRAALLYCAGIDPFDPDCLLWDETTMGTSVLSTARNKLKTDLLGITTSVMCASTGTSTSTSGAM